MRALLGFVLLGGGALALGLSAGRALELLRPRLVRADGPGLDVGVYLLFSYYLPIAGSLFLGGLLLLLPPRPTTRWPRLARAVAVAAVATALVAFVRFLAFVAEQVDRARALGLMPADALQLALQSVVLAVPVVSFASLLALSGAVLWQAGRAPAAPVRPRRAAPRLPRSAVPAGVALALVLALGGGLTALALFRAASPNVPAALVVTQSGCVVSAEQPSLGMVGGNLVARVSGGRFLESEPYRVVWSVRMTEPPEAITLRVERIDEPGTEYELYLARIRGDATLQSGWAPFDYPSELVFPEAGCWRATLLEGTAEDAVFFEVLPPLTSR